MGRGSTARRCAGVSVMLNASNRRNTNAFSASKNCASVAFPRSDAPTRPVCVFAMYELMKTSLLGRISILPTTSRRAPISFPSRGAANVSTRRVSTSLSSRMTASRRCRSTSTSPGLRERSVTSSAAMPKPRAAYEVSGRLYGKRSNTQRVVRKVCDIQLRFLRDALAGESPRRRRCVHFWSQLRAHTPRSRRLMQDCLPTAIGLLHRCVADCGANCRGARVLLLMVRVQPFWSIFTGAGAAQGATDVVQQQQSSALAGG